MPVTVIFEASPTRENMSPIGSMISAFTPVLTVLSAIFLSETVRLSMSLAKKLSFTPMLLTTLCFASLSALKPTEYTDMSFPEAILASEIAWLANITEYDFIHLRFVSRVRSPFPILSFVIRSAVRLLFE